MIHGAAVLHLLPGWKKSDPDLWQPTSNWYNREPFCTTATPFLCASSVTENFGQSFFNSPCPHNLIGSIYHFKIWRQLWQGDFQKDSLNESCTPVSTNFFNTSLKQNNKIPIDWRLKVTTVSSAISPPSPLKYGQISPSFQARLLASNSIELSWHGKHLKNLCLVLQMIVVFNMMV